MTAAASITSCMRSWTTRSLSTSRGKFGGTGYKVSGGRHGVGVSAVNALSDLLKLEIRRNGKVYYQEYSRGIPITEFRQTGTTQSGERHGTKITFHPDPEIFKNVLE